MELETLSHLAFQGKPLPKHLGLCEQSLYLGLRSLYWDFQKGLFTKDQATKEKGLLLRAYHQAKANEQERLTLFRYMDSMRIRLAQAQPILAFTAPGPCQPCCSIYLDTATSKRRFRLAPPSPAASKGSFDRFRCH